MSTDERAAKRLSRREIPAKAPLSREGIVAAALRILRAEGLSKVTMRRVAQELDTGHASLYVYVRDTRDLHAQVLDALLEPVVARERHVPGWREELAELLRGYYRVMAAHAEIARAAMNTRPDGPNYLRLLDRLLALMIAGGISETSAAWAVDLLMLYPTALAVEHPLDASSGDAGKPWNADRDLSALPRLKALYGDLFSGSNDDRFRWAIDTILAGAAVTGVPRGAGHAGN